MISHFCYDSGVFENHFSLFKTRAFMAILGISVVNRFKRKNTFIVCDGLMCSGTFILATYCYFNQDESLTLAFPYAKWIPILAIMLMYVAFAC